ncbi:zinc finger protein 425-like [Planococcus citri]|uniref:zinc finger protein 425-like n=1 Tax=Planococcus citri TaxID=170843 RepID=UPI0031F7E84F
MVAIVVTNIKVTGKFICLNACGRQYKYKRDLKRHMKYECGLEKHFKCPNCPKAFRRGNQLKTHIEHFTTKEFVCPNYCGHHYKRKGDLQRHWKYECGQPKLFKCPQCPKSYGRKSKSKGIFICPNTSCGRQYKYRQGLWAHLKFECGQQKQFQCAYCTKAFHHKTKLRRHIVTVHKILV